MEDLVKALAKESERTQHEFYLKAESPCAYYGQNWQVRRASIRKEGTPSFLVLRSWTCYQRVCQLDQCNSEIH